MRSWSIDGLSVFCDITKDSKNTLGVKKGRLGVKKGRLGVKNGRLGVKKPRLGDNAVTNTIFNDILYRFI